MNFKKWLLLNEKTMIKDQEFRDPFSALQHIQKTHPNPENLVVTFTAIDKVGLNPRSIFETPLGIYLYPIDYVIQKKMYVPFAGEHPNINVCEFTRPQKILHMNSDVSNQKGMELLNVFPKEQVDQASENIDKYEIRSNYSKLWLLTKILANNKPTQWNINLKKCGIDGFMDHGTKTIHHNEPTQCIVFAANALKLLHSIVNPIYEKKIDKYGVSTYDIRKDKYDSSKMEDEKIIRMLQSRRNLNIESLIDSVTDKNKVVELIVKHKLIIYDEDLPIFLSKATDKDKIAEQIIEKKSELNDRNVRVLLDATTDKDKIAELIIGKKLELSQDNVKNLLNAATDKDKIAELIIEKKPEFSDDEVKNLLLYVTDKEQITKVLRTDNISKLSDENVGNLFDDDYVTDKDKMAQIINQYHTNKTPKIKEIISKYNSGFFKRIFNLGKKVVSTGSFT